MIVKQDETAPVATEVLATAIVRIGEAAEKLLGSGLSERALIVLLHDSTGVGKPAIRDVLSGLKTLRDIYVVKRPAKNEPKR